MPFADYRDRIKYNKLHYAPRREHLLAKRHAYVAEKRDVINAREREHYKLNLGGRADRQRRTSARYTRDHSAGRRIKRLKREYGLTPEAFAAMEKKQGNCCRICRTPGKLVVDHDHSTGRVRDLLCSRCNSGLGFLKDSVPVLKAALLYLKEHKGDANDA